MDTRNTFRAGEMIRIKESFFRIKSIKPNELRLKLLSSAQSEAVRRAELTALRQEREVNFVTRAEAAEEQSFLRALATKDKRAASEILIALRQAYQGRLARIEMKLEELAPDLLKDDFSSIEEAVDAMIAQEQKAEFDAENYDEDPWAEELKTPEWFENKRLQEELQAQEESRIQEMATAAEEDWPDFEDPETPIVARADGKNLDSWPDFEVTKNDLTRVARDAAELGCLRHDFSDDRQICRVCGLSIEAFRAREAAAEDALRQMRDELLGKGAP